MNHRWQHWLDAIAESLRAREVHPARAVVLLPYAQLMPVAARLWGARCPVGFAPRFETTQNWTQTLAGTLAAAGAPMLGQEGADLRFKPALDLLTAHALLEQAGLGAQAAVAAPLLLEAAQQLAPLAAAQAPAQRAAWGERASQAVRAGFEEGLDGQVLRLEAAVAQIAVAWVVNSSYGSDVLFSSEVRATTDCLLVLPGLQADPLVEGLRQAWGDALVLLEAPEIARDTLPAGATNNGAVLALHEAADAADEAERAAACVLRHLQAGRAPVAVAVIDRALTRRVRAMLARHGVQMRDETGWKLSTTRAGAQVMVALRACARDASSDAVLDWLKHAPACDQLALRRLESELRRQPRRLWRHALAGLVEAGQAKDEPDELQGLLREVDSWRAAITAGRGTRTLQEWLDALHDLLQRCGLWDVLIPDEAGREVASALHYALDESGRATPRLPVEALWALQRWSLGEFTAWVDRALESAIFKPAYPLREQAVLLPLAQMLGRDFGAIVLPGCDERSLPAAPEPGGPWTAAQRAALGLPSREAMQAAQLAAWGEALARDCPVDILWRRSDADGEPLLASPLVQRLLALGPAWREDSAAEDPRDRRAIAAVPTPRPSPRLIPAWVEVLRPERLSASAYQDLRHCPYRFHALRLLGLREVEEIEGELDKRDFGLWLHAVLQTFHAQDTPNGASREDRAARLDAAAQAVAREQRLADDEFLPFQAAWPRLREGYLDWLTKHEAEGWRFALGEHAAEQALDVVTLFGRLDRVDRASGGLMVMDYKTEAEQTTRARVKDALEDTQLAFYAVLLSRVDGEVGDASGADPVEAGLRAAYVNVGEGETRLFEQPEIALARAALLEGVAHDLKRIAQGASLTPLGEGAVCDTCAARGLCRKDFWNE